MASTTNTVIKAPQNMDTAVWSTNTRILVIQAVIASVFADAKAAGKPVGILAPLEAHARNYLAMGATFVGVGSDLGAFRSATQALHDRYRN